MTAMVALKPRDSEFRERRECGKKLSFKKGARDTGEGESLEIVDVFWSKEVH